MRTCCLSRHEKLLQSWTVIQKVEGQTGLGPRTAKIILVIEGFKGMMVKGP